MLRPQVLVLLAFVLPGCLGTRHEKVHVRRPPAEIDRTRKAMRPMTSSELDELFKREQEKRRVDPDTQRWSDHYRDARAEVDAEMATVPGDPWRAEELERRRVILGRAWSDLPAKTPPTPDPLPEPRGDFADPLDDPSRRPTAPAEGEGSSEESEEESDSEE